MNEDELKLRMDHQRYGALTPREKYLLNLNDADRYGTPRLVLASTFGDLEMAKSLISEGVDLNAASSNDMGIRMVASTASPTPEQLHELEMLKAAIPQELWNRPSADTPKSSHSTALMAASRFGFVEIAEVLLDAGAQIEKQDFRGATALFIAAENRHVNIVKLLLAQEANPAHVSTDRRTFLHAAVSGGDISLVELALDYPHQINARSAYGDTALLVASWKRRANIARILIQHGADANIADDEGTTPLIATAPDDDYPAPVGTELSSILLEHGADVNAADTEGWTALMGASFYGDFELAKLLLSAGAKVSSTDKQGRTALGLALQCDHADIAELLKALSDKN